MFIPVRNLVGDRELQKKDPANVALTLYPPYLVQKLQSRSWDLMMRKGGAQKRLNEYFDRECERI